MSVFRGEKIKLCIFGGSHEPAIGMTLEGIPAGVRIDPEKLEAFLKRRAPGRSPYSTPRKEPDKPEFICGTENGVTTGAPITAVIRNRDVRSADYGVIADVPRPGHADYTAFVKYGPERDVRGGGRFSGRLTAPLCIAGGIVLQILESMGMTVTARILSVGKVTDDGAGEADEQPDDLPVSCRRVEQAMKQAIENAKASGDSLGGVIECTAEGVPAGLGGPMFEGLESRISAIVFGIPAVKGIEFGSGFGSARIPGSENNDAFFFDENGKVRTETNHCGGILGGISDGMPIVFRAAIKPTPSISKPQKSIDLKNGGPAVLRVPGRHDPCIVPRAVPVMEAAAALAIFDAMEGISGKG